MKLGDVIDGKYQLVRLLGEGGMGSVYEAVHTRIRSKRAAVKLIHSQLLSDPHVVVRFEREAEAASAIGHEGIVDIYDLDTAGDGSPYMVMEYLEGQSLQAVLESSSGGSGQGVGLDLDLTIYVVGKVLSVLVAAHAAGVIHRDLKPDNIFLVANGSEPPRVKLLDFGIARIKEYGGPSKELSLTSTGTIMGTPYFMSPEQALGFKDRIDQRTDIWSVGVILYLCATGQYPFEGENYNQVLSKIITDDEPSGLRMLNPAVPSELERIVLRAMSKDLEKRYSSAHEMLSDLRLLAQAPAPSFVALPEGLSSDGTMSGDAQALPTSGVGSGISATQFTPASVELATTTTPTVVPANPARSRPTRQVRLMVFAVGLLLVVGIGSAAMTIAFSGDTESTDVPVTQPISNTSAPDTPTPEPTKTSAPPAVVPTKNSALPATVEASKAPIPVEQQGGGPAAEEEGDASVISTSEAPSQPSPPAQVRSNRRQERPQEPVTSPSPTRPTYGRKLPRSSRPTRPDYRGTKL